MAIESSGLQHEVLFHRKWGPNGGYRVRGEVATVGGARPERSPVGPRSPTHLRSLLFVLFLLCNGCSRHRVASSLHLHPQARVSFSCPFRVVAGLEVQCAVGLNLSTGKAQPLEPCRCGPVAAALRSTSYQPCVFANYTRFPRHYRLV